MLRAARLPRWRFRRARARCSISGSQRIPDRAQAHGSVECALLLDVVEDRRIAMNKFRRTLGASTLIQDKVVNLAGQDVGQIEELMIDVTTGRVAYAVMSFGGFLGIGNKLFALPWAAVTVDETKKRFVVNVTKESLDELPGFDKDHWPDLGDLEFAAGVYRQWSATPYWT
ncbi:MAG: PRC-barrel domain-containing protein [Kofleriaceae bacterium]